VTSAPISPARTLRELLSTELLGNDIGIAVGRPATTLSARMFGGQLLAQALMASAEGVAGDRVPASVHGFFLRPADAARETQYHTSVLRRGRTLDTHVVDARQDGRVTATVIIRWHRSEPLPEFDHEKPATKLPDCPDPAPLPYPAPGVITEALDLRWVTTDEGRALWFRVMEPVAPNPVMRAALTLYVSDLWLLDTALRAVGHRFNSLQVRCGTTEHAMWFHRPPVPSEWSILCSEAPVVASGRGSIRAQLRYGSGQLAASAVQEVSVQPRDS
jgi:acyl-CoA thioesterase II